MTSLPIKSPTIPESIVDFYTTEVIERACKKTICDGDQNINMEWELVRNLNSLSGQTCNWTGKRTKNLTSLLFIMFILLGESGSADTVSQETLSQGTLAVFGLCGMKKGEFLEVGDKTVSDKKTIHVEWEIVLIWMKCLLLVNPVDLKHPKAMHIFH